MRFRTRIASRSRRGAAAVEFAMVAPVFVTIVMGVSQASKLFETQNQLAVAAREGARLAAMDRTGMLHDGQTMNAKIADDIAHFLTANGLPGDEADVFIVDPDNHTSTFDLDDPANELALFEVRVELPYAALTSGGGSINRDWKLSAKIVFRNARAAIVQ